MTSASYCVVSHELRLAGSFSDFPASLNKLASSVSRGIHLFSFNGRFRIARRTSIAIVGDDVRSRLFGSPSHVSATSPLFRRFNYFTRAISVLISSIFRAKQKPASDKTQLQLSVFLTFVTFLIQTASRIVAQYQAVRAAFARLGTSFISDGCDFFYSLRAKIKNQGMRELPDRLLLFRSRFPRPAVYHRRVIPRLQATALSALLFFCLDVRAIWLPGFTVEPTNAVAHAGGTASFFAEAVIGGGESISYLWLRNGAQIEGATNQTLLVPNVTFAMQQDAFRAVAIGSGGGRSTSMLARVVVPNSPPIIVGWPSQMKRHAIAGTNIQFGAGTIGAEPMSYQWYDGANPLHGERGSALLVSNNYSSGPFYAVVSNAVGVATGAVSTVHVSYSMEVLRKWETNSVAVIDITPGPSADFYSLRESLSQTVPPQPTISRHGTNLQPLWSFQSLSTVKLNQLGTDNDGNIYAWGQAANSFSWGTNQVLPNTTLTQVFLGKLSSDGQALWAVPHREGRMSRAAGLVVQSNEVWTTAATVVQVSISLGMAQWYPTVRKFNLDGALEEIFPLTNVPPFQRFTNMVATGFEPKRFSLLPDGGFVMAGSSHYTQLPSAQDWQVGAVVAYDRNGQVRWWAEYTSEDQWNETGTIFGMAVDDGGNTYVSGRFGEIHSRSGAFLSKRAPDGTEIWRERARTDYWQTGSGVYPWTLEVAPNGNIRMAGLARYTGGLYYLGGDYLPELPFLHEFSPDGELLNTTYFEIGPGANRDTDTLDIMAQGGEVLICGRLRTFPTPRGFLATLGYTKAPVSTNSPSHVIFWDSVGGTIRPKFKAVGPAAFEWRRDGQIMPNDNFSYLALSPTEVERAADYTLIVQTIGGAATNAAISVGNARMLREPLGIEVHSPVGASFEVRGRVSFEATDSWQTVTNVTSTGLPVTVPFTSGTEFDFFQLIAK